MIERAYTPLFYKLLNYPIKQQNTRLLNYMRLNRAQRQKLVKLKKY